MNIRMFILISFIFLFTNLFSQNAYHEIYYCKGNSSNNFGPKYYRAQLILYEDSTFYLYHLRFYTKKARRKNVFGAIREFNGNWALLLDTLALSYKVDEYERKMIFIKKDSEIYPYDMDRKEPINFKWKLLD